MLIGVATPADWGSISPVWHAVVDAGTTYMWAPGTGDEAARAAWMLPPPAVVYAVWDGAELVGTAQLRPNQPGLGDHVANAAFMVAPGHAGRGVGRRLAGHVIAGAVALGYRGMQFNAVVETNTTAVRLWTSLGFRIVGTVPGVFRHATSGVVGAHVMYRSLP